MCIEHVYIDLNAEFLGRVIQELRSKKACAGIHIMAVHYPEAFPALFEYVK